MAKRGESRISADQPNPKKQATTPAASWVGDSLEVPIQALPSNPPINGASTAAAPRGDGAQPPFPTIIEGNDPRNVLSNMRSIIPWVRYHSKQHVRSIPELSRQFADVDLHQHQPLDIKTISETTLNELKSFKHPWCREKAKHALEGTSLYEASASIWWCDPLPPVAGDMATIAAATATWQEILDMATHDFSLSTAHRHAGSVRNSSQVQGNSYRRQVFSSICNLFS